MIKLRIFNISYERGRQILLFLFCLFLAFVIWSIHKLSESYTVYLQYKVTASAGLEGRSGEADSENYLIVRGKATWFYILQHRYSGTINKIYISPERREIRRRAGVTDGFYVLVKDVNDRLIQSFGNTLFVESFATDTLFYFFPGQTNKRVPVKPDFIISYAPQYTLNSTPKLSPDSVTLYGESTLLSKIDSVFTKQLKFQNLDKSVQGVVELIPEKGVRFSSGDISYSMDIVRYVEKSIQLPLSFVNVPDGIILKSNPSEVTLYFREKFGEAPNDAASVTMEVDYHDFETSINGVVKVLLSGNNKGVLSWRADPPFVEVSVASVDTLK